MLPPMGRFPRCLLITFALAAYYAGGLAAAHAPWVPPCLPRSVLYAPASLIYPLILFVTADGLWQVTTRQIFAPAERRGFGMWAFQLGGSVIFTFAGYIYLRAYKDHCYCAGLLGLEPGEDCLDAGNRFARLFEFAIACAGWGASRLGWAVFGATETAASEPP